MTRFAYPRRASIATYFTQQNCGKRNLSLDLKKPEALALLHGLVDRADVVLENFRPGVMDRLGLGPDALRARNPRLVYCSITGYGHTGPWTGRRAYAPVVGAEAGVTWLQGQARHGEYANDPLSHGDVYAALEAVSGILAALYQRERTGQGQWVELSMAETLLSVNEHVHWELRDDPELTGDDDVPSFLPGDYPVLPTAEGPLGGDRRPSGEQRHLRALLPGHGAPRPHRRPPPVVRRRPPAQLRRSSTPRLAAWSSTFDDLDAIEEAFAAQGLAMGVLRTVREIGESDWASARGAVVEVSDRAGGRRAGAELALALLGRRQRCAGRALLPRRAQPGDPRRDARARRRGHRPPRGRRRALVEAAPGMTAPRPMKAVSGDMPTETEGWAYEIKWDGFRSLAVIDGETVKVYSSNGIDVTAKRSELAGLWRGLHGRPGGARRGARRPRRPGPAALPAAGRRHARHLSCCSTCSSWTARTSPGCPSATGAASSTRRWSRDRTGWWAPGRRATAPRCCEASREQRPRGHHGQAPRQHLPPGPAIVGLAQDQEPAPPGDGDRRAGPRASGRRASTFGALLVGHYEGDVLRYAGGVGTGFTDKAPAGAHAPSWRPAPRRRVPSTLRPRRVQLRHQRAHWVRPELVGEVEFAEWTDEGILRHPSFLGLRDDKDRGRSCARNGEPCAEPAVTAGWPAPPPGGRSRRAARGGWPA